MMGFRKVHNRNITPESPWECHPPINCWLEKAICLKTSLGVAVRRLVNAYRVITTQFQINLIDREIDVIEWISNCWEISHWVTGDWALIERWIKHWLFRFCPETKNNINKKGTLIKNGWRTAFANEVIVVIDLKYIVQ